MLINPVSQQSQVANQAIPYMYVFIHIDKGSLTTLVGLVSL